MTLSRGARRLLETIRRHACKHPEVFVLRATFARWLKCSAETIGRWVRELKQLGLLVVRQCGPQSAIYDLQQASLDQLYTADRDRALTYQKPAFEQAPPISINQGSKYRKHVPYNPPRKPPEQEENYILPHMREALKEYMARFEKTSVG